MSVFGLEDEICRYLENLLRLQNLRETIELTHEKLEEFENAHDKLAVRLQEELENAQKPDKHIEGTSG